MTQTTMCNRCLKKKAAIWSGHVKHGKKTLIAGWCKRCLGYWETKPGFVGHYLKAMK